MRLIRRADRPRPHPGGTRGRAVLGILALGLVALMPAMGHAEPASIACDAAGKTYYDGALKTGARYGRSTTDSPSTKKTKKTKEVITLSGCRGARSDGALASETKKGSLSLSGSFAPVSAFLPSSDADDTCGQELSSGAYSLTIPLSSGSQKSKGRYIGIREASAFTLILLGSDGHHVLSGTWTASGTCSSKAGVARATVDGTLIVSPVPSAGKLPSDRDATSITCRLEGRHWYAPPLREGRAIGFLQTDSYFTSAIDSIPLTGCLGANVERGPADPVRRGSLWFEGFFLDTGTLYSLLVGGRAPTGNDACIDEADLATFKSAIPLSDGSWLRAKGGYIAVRHEGVQIQAFVSEDMPGAAGLLGITTWTPEDTCGARPVYSARLAGYLTTIPY